MSPANFSHTLCESFRTDICFETEERTRVLSRISLGRSATVGSVAFARVRADGAWENGIPGCVRVEDRLQSEQRLMVPAPHIKVRRLQQLSAAGEQYVVDEHGNRVAVILPLREYEQLQEDLHDLAVVAERREEPTIGFDELKKRYRD